MTVEADNEAIKPLDWHNLACQNPAGCTNTAAYTVTIHARDHCNDPDLDPFGNEIHILCGYCIAEIHVETAIVLAAHNRFGISGCTTCQAPMTEITDIIRDLTEL